MFKRSFFYCIVSLVLGLLAGYFYAEDRANRAAANAYAALQILDLGQSSEHAWKAYQHESKPVAIYALTELLDKQQAVGETSFFSRQEISVDLILTHARLAKLYDDVGQTNLSALHITEALRYASANSNLAISNQDSLVDFVAKIDKGSK
jgi:hypothetical protein